MLLYTIAVAGAALFEADLLLLMLLGAAIGVAGPSCSKLLA
jgi:hypothetical protein